MKSADRTFFANFLVVLAALVGIAIFVGIAAGMINSAQEEKDGIDPRAATVIGERIEPVGKVAVGEPPAESGATQTAAAPPKKARSGEEVVNSVCAGCHAVGVAGAPKLGDKAVWKALLGAGFDAVVTNSINGKGGMPPRGGSDATDEEMHAAVMFMFKQAGVNP